MSTTPEYLPRMVADQKKEIGDLKDEITHRDKIIEDNKKDLLRYSVDLDKLRAEIAGLEREAGQQRQAGLRLRELLAARENELASYKRVATVLAVGLLGLLAILVVTVMF